MGCARVARPVVGIAEHHHRAILDGRRGSLFQMREPLLAQFLNGPALLGGRVVLVPAIAHGFQDNAALPFDSSTALMDGANANAQLLGHFRGRLQACPRLEELLFCRSARHDSLH